MNLKLLFALIAALALASAAPAFAQIETVHVKTSQGEDVEKSTALWKNRDAQLPVKIVNISVLPTVVLTEQSGKKLLSADAPNRAEAEEAAKVIAKKFSDELAKAGITISANAETAIELRLYFSNAPEKFRMSSMAKVSAKGSDEATIGLIVAQVKKGPAKEWQELIEDAATTMVTNLIKNIAIVDKAAQR